MDTHCILLVPILILHSGTCSVVLLSRDGSGCSGVFMVVYSQLEKLKVEGMVDVFQCIKTLRTKRPGIVADVVRACTNGRYEPIK